MLLMKIGLIQRLIEQAQQMTGQVHEGEEGQGGVYIGGGAVLIILIVILLIMLL
jgi:hypothetical protein